MKTIVPRCETVDNSCFFRGMSASAAESLQKGDGRMVSAFWTKCHYALDTRDFCRNNGHCLSTNPYRRQPPMGCFKQKLSSTPSSSCLNFTTFELAALPSTLHFCFNPRLLSTHLFCFTASKVLGSGRERGARDLSPDPFHSSCYSLSLDYPIFKNYNVLSNTQAHNLGTIFDFWLPSHQHSIRDFSRNIVAWRNPGGKKKQFRTENG